MNNTTYKSIKSLLVLSFVFVQHVRAEKTFGEKAGDLWNSATEVTSHAAKATAAKIRSVFSDVKARAEKGEAQAQWELSQAHLNGTDGLKKDAKEAFRYAKLAADQGYEDAEAYVEDAYKNGTGVAKETAEKAVARFKKAAAKGSARAKFNLAEAYATGKGVKADEAEALRYYKEAAKDGHKAAEKKVTELSKKKS